MRLIPTKRQFKGWKLPSQLTFIGVCLGIAFFIIGSVLWAISYWVSASKNDIWETSDKISAEHTKTREAFDERLQELEERLSKTYSSYHDHLKAKYLYGYAMFYIDGSNYIFRQYKTDQVTIDWGQTRLDDITPTTVRINVPDFYVTGQHIKFERRSGGKLILPLPRNENYFIIFIKFRHILLCGETIHFPNNFEVYVVGFVRKR